MDHYYVGMDHNLVLPKAATSVFSHDQTLGMWRGWMFHMGRAGWRNDRISTPFQRRGPRPDHLSLAASSAIRSPGNVADSQTAQDTSIWRQLRVDSVNPVELHTNIYVYYLFFQATEKNENIKRNWFAPTTLSHDIATRLWRMCIGRSTSFYEYNYIYIYTTTHLQLWPQA